MPNIFVANWIKSNYLESIADAFMEENANGIRPEIHIKVKEKKQNVKSLNFNKIQTHFQQNLLSLNPFYTFEKFVVGKSNEHAYTIAKVVAEAELWLIILSCFMENLGLARRICSTLWGMLSKSRIKMCFIRLLKSFSMTL